MTSAEIRAQLIAAGVLKPADGRTAHDMLLEEILGNRPTLRLEVVTRAKREIT